MGTILDFRAIKRVMFSPSSIVTSLFIALGYESDAIRDRLKTLQFEAFFDIDLEYPRLLTAAENLWQIFKDGIVHDHPATHLLDRLLKLPGICLGDAFRTWAEEQIARRTGISDCTLGEWNQLIAQGKPYKHLHFMIVCLNERDSIYSISSEDETWKDLVIADLAGIAFTIAGISKPHELYAKIDGRRVLLTEMGACVSAALSGHIQIETFDRLRFVIPGSTSDEPVFNQSTQAINLYNPERYKELRYNELPDKSLSTLFMAMLQAHHHIEGKKLYNSAYNAKRVLAALKSRASAALVFNESRRPIPHSDTTVPSRKPQISPSVLGFSDSIWPIPHSDATVPSRKPEISPRTAPPRVRVSSPHVSPHVFPPTFINLRAASTFFIGRDSELKKIFNTFFSETGRSWRDSSRTIGIAGQSGMGKSELACTFAHRYSERFSMIALIDCGSLQSQKSSLLDLGRYLQKPLPPTLVPAKMAQVLFDALEERNNNKPWFLILDNVVEAISPPQRGGFVIVTGKNPDLFSSRNAFHFSGTFYHGRGEDLGKENNR